MRGTLLALLLSLAISGAASAQAPAPAAPPPGQPGPVSSAKPAPSCPAPGTILNCINASVTDRMCQNFNWILENCPGHMDRTRPGIFLPAPPG